jgi:hypothetical protein
MDYLNDSFIYFFIKTDVCSPLTWILSIYLISYQMYISYFTHESIKRKMKKIENEK